MSSLLYRCYCSIDKNESLEIERKVQQNRTYICKNTREFRKKTNKIIIELVLASQIIGVSLPVSNAISIPFSSITSSSNRLINNRKSELVPVVCKYGKSCFSENKEIPKIQLTNRQIQKFENLADQLYRRQITME